MNKKLRIALLVVLPVLLVGALWRASKQRLRPLPELKGGLLAWSDGGTHLACASLDGKARVWDFNAGKVVCQVTHGVSFAEGVGLSPDGKLLATSSQGMSWPDEKLPVDIWDVDSGKKLFSIAPTGLGARGLSFSPDGKNLCVLKGGDVSLYDTGNQFRLLRKLPIKRGEYSLAFNGQIVVASGSQGVEAFDLKTNKLLPVPPASFGSFYAVALSNDGKVAASGGQFGLARVWDVATGKVICQISSPVGGDFAGLALSHDGSVLLTSGTAGVLSWNVSPTTKTPITTWSQKGGSSEGTWVVFPRNAGGFAFSDWQSVLVKGG